MKVVFDTNVVVSRFLSPVGPPARLFALWETQAFHLVVSEPILAEYQRVLQYEHVAARHGMTPEEITEIIEYLRQLALVVAPTEAITPGFPRYA